MFALIWLFIKLLILPIKLLIELVELLVRVAASGSSRRTSRAHHTGASNTNAGCLVLLAIVGVGLIVAIVVGVIHNPRTLLSLLPVAAIIGGVMWLCVWLGHRGQRPAVPVVQPVPNEPCPADMPDDALTHASRYHVCSLTFPHQGQPHICACGSWWMA